MTSDAANVPVVSRARGDAEGAREARYAEAIAEAVADVWPGEGFVGLRGDITRAVATVVMAVADEEHSALRRQWQIEHDVRISNGDKVMELRDALTAAEDRLRKVAELAEDMDERGKPGPSDSEADRISRRQVREDTKRIRTVLADPLAAPECGVPFKIYSTSGLAETRNCTREAGHGCGHYSLTKPAPAPVSSGEAGTGEAAAWDEGFEAGATFREASVLRQTNHTRVAGWPALRRTMPAPVSSGEAATGEYVRLDDYLSAQPTAQCSDCERLTWEVDALGTVCAMTQPDRTSCPGTFRPAPVVAPSAEGGES